MGFFSKIAEGLKKTKNSLSSALDGMLSVFTKIDDELFEELEEILIMSDVSVSMAEKICTELRAKVKAARTENPEDIKGMLREIITGMLADGQNIKTDTKPSIIVMIGVNGAGKTTTIGKMALRYKKEGKSVILGAADTFRAAAIEQLEVWSERAGVPMIKQKEGSDPPPWFSTPFRPQRQGAAISSFAIRPDGFTTKKDLCTSLTRSPA